MSTSDQRWLSLDGLCTQLGMTKSQVALLVKQGTLVALGTGPRRRYLDPTPEYAAKLRLGETLYDITKPLPKDLELLGLLTVREVAAIMGWTLRYAQTYLWTRKKTPSIKVGPHRLYSIAVVRNLLWKREGNRQRSQRAPFLLKSMIRFFLDYYNAENEVVPSDADFAADDILMRKFSRLAKLPSPQREEAYRELWKKVSLAKQVATALQDSSPTDR